MKLQLTVPSMVCSACSDTVTRAIQSLDPSAVVHIDLSTKTVSIETQALESQVTSAILAVGHELS